MKAAEIHLQTKAKQEAGALTIIGDGNCVNCAYDTGVWILGGVVALAAIALVVILKRSGGSPKK